MKTTKVLMLERGVSPLKSEIKQGKGIRAIFRIIVYLLIALGIKFNIISTITGIHRTTIFRYRKRKDHNKSWDFNDKPRKGRPRKVTPEFEKRVLEIALVSPRVFGYNRNYWTLQSLCEHMAKETNIQISKSTMRRILKNNRFTCHRPKQRVYSPDPEYFKKKKDIEKLLANPPKSTVILYADEKDCHHSPTIKKMYQPKGEQIKINTPGRNVNLRVFGAWDPFKKRLAAWQIHNRKRTEEFIEFLKHLQKTISKKKIILILDNYGIHKSKKLKKFFEENPAIRDKFEFKFLPSYSPHLNPIEGFWRTLKHYVETNYLHLSIDAFRLAIEQYLLEQSKIDRITSCQK